MTSKQNSEAPNATNSINPQSKYSLRFEGGIAFVYFLRHLYPRASGVQYIRGFYRTLENFRDLL